MDIVDPKIEGYMKNLARGHDEDVLVEMEALAAEKNFPIIGRLCGMYLELMARAVGAKRVFEMGSGYGYSGYWFSRAVGADGEIHLTDMDPKNERKALDFLGRAGLDGPIEYHVSDAFSAFDATSGDFDVVYCDIDKATYPEAWERAKQRVRVGGLYMCDNMLWSGRVVSDDLDPNDVLDSWTAAIDATNRAIFSDPDWHTIINPTRDGVITALRLR